MDGVFVRKKSNLWLTVFILCGLFFIILYFGASSANPEITRESTVFLIMGIVFGLTAILAMLLNRGAYIHVEENLIQAKYHWFGKINCSMEDVEFVMPQFNTLSILLKNGKRHIIMGVDNSWALSSAIRRQCFQMEKELPDNIRQKILEIEAARKKKLWWVLGFGALMFANILVAVLLTDGKEFDEFSNVDWKILAVMGFAELLTVAALFYAAQRCGEDLLPMEHFKYRLCGAVVATEPLPSNQITAVYTDENLEGRIAVCGFPNDESVYFVVQKIVGNCELETIHTSNIYEDMEALGEDQFSKLIDISSYYI